MDWARGDEIQVTSCAYFCICLASWPRIPDRLLTAHLRFLMWGAEEASGIRHVKAGLCNNGPHSPGPGGENISHNVRAAGNSTPKSFLSSPRDSFLIESRCQGSGKKGNKARHYTKVSPEYHDWICVKNKSQGSIALETWITNSSIILSLLDNRKCLSSIYHSVVLGPKGQRLHFPDLMH